MLLRRSGAEQDTTYNLAAATGQADSDIGVPHEACLVAIAEAVVSGDQDELAEIRVRGEAEIGTQSLVDAIAVAAGFNGITRVANATGIPLDPSTEVTTTEMRSATGIDEFDDGVKSRRYAR